MIILVTTKTCRIDDILQDRILYLREKFGEIHSESSYRLFAELDTPLEIFKDTTSNLQQIYTAKAIGGLWYDDTFISIWLASILIRYFHLIIGNCCITP